MENIYDKTFKMESFDRPATYFPILLEYEDGKQSIAHTPQEILPGIGFKILVTKYRWPEEITENGFC